jgi:hypothetical protein
MNTTAPTRDPDHWRRRAEDARRHAAEAIDPEIKSELLEIARNYERVAELVATTK